MWGVTEKAMPKLKAVGTGCSTSDVMGVPPKPPPPVVTSWVNLWLMKYSVWKSAMTAGFLFMVVTRGALSSSDSSRLFR